MSDDDPIATLADIDLDIEAAQQGMARFSEQLADAKRAVTAARSGPLRTRGSAPASAKPRCPAEALEGYQVVLHLESTFPADYDHSCVIFAGCQLLEAELDRLVTTPLFPLAATLVDVLRRERGIRGPAEVLEGWAGGRKHATFGTHGLVVLALQDACVRDHPTLLPFLRDRFEPGYLDLLRSRAPDRCLNRIRNRYRNPAGHGKARFTHADYADFARLVIAHRCFLEWNEEGPDPASPGGEMGVLHHHWRLARQPEETA